MGSQLGLFDGLVVLSLFRHARAYLCCVGAVSQKKPSGYGTRAHTEKVQTTRQAGVFIFFRCCRAWIEPPHSALHRTNPMTKMRPKITSAVTKPQVRVAHASHGIDVRMEHIKQLVDAFLLPHLLPSAHPSIGACMQPQPRTRKATTHRQGTSRWVSACCPLGVQP